MRAILSVTVFAAVVLAGCQDMADPLPDFDGDATLAIVEQVVYADDGSLRVRSPGMAGHSDTAAWLADRLTVDGWLVRSDVFTGSDYQALDKGAVGTHASPGACPQEDQQQLPSFTFTNLYATKAGEDAGGGHVVLAAHWDAKEDAHGGGGPIPAANDGASGVAVLLRLQHYIEENDLAFPFDLSLALLDGEDGFEDCHPLAGSLWAARNGSLGDITQFVLLDMVGDADARFIQESQSLGSDPELVEALWDQAAQQGLGDHFTDSRRSITDDHVPFIEEGIPAIDIIDAGRDQVFPPYWHTMDDTPDRLSADMLGSVGDLMVWMLTDPDAQALL